MNKMYSEYVKEVSEKGDALIAEWEAKKQAIDNEFVAKYDAMKKALKLKYKQ